MSIHVGHVQAGTHFEENYVRQAPSRRGLRAGTYAQSGAYTWGHQGKH